MPIARDGPGLPQIPLNRGRRHNYEKLRLLAVIGARRLLRASALLRGCAARAASTAVLTRIRLALRLLVLRLLVRRPLLRLVLPLRLLVSGARLGLGSRLRPGDGLLMDLRPLVGGRENPPVVVPARVALPDWCSSERGLRLIVSGVQPVRRPVIYLPVRPVVGIAVIVSVPVARYDVLEIVDSNDAEHRPDDHRRDKDQRRGHRIEPEVRPIPRPIVVLIVLAVVRIPVIPAVRPVHDEVEESRDDDRAEHDTPDGAGETDNGWACA